MSTNQNLNLAAFFSEALPYVDTWTPTTINEGGCGAFAKALCDELKEHGLKYKIFALYFNKESLTSESNVKAFIKTGKIPSKKDTGADHIVVLVEDQLYVDSMGIENVKVNMCIDKIELSYDQLSTLVEDGTWNPTFDRDCMPTIISKLKEAFKHENDFTLGMFKYPKRDEVEFTPHTIKYKRMQNPFGF